MKPMNVKIEDSHGNMTTITVEHVALLAINAQQAMDAPYAWEQMRDHFVGWHIPIKRGKVTTTLGEIAALYRSICRYETSYEAQYSDSYVRYLNFCGVVAGMFGFDGSDYRNRVWIAQSANRDWAKR